MSRVFFETWRAADSVEESRASVTPHQTAVAGIYQITADCARLVELDRIGHSLLYVTCALGTGRPYHI